MLVYAVGFISICYGIKEFTRLWRKSAKFNALVMLLLCVVTAGYCLPVISNALPTVESLYSFVFYPVSHYFLNLLHIHLENL